MRHGSNGQLFRYLTAPCCCGRQRSRLSAAVLLRANIRDLWARLKGFIALSLLWGVQCPVHAHSGQPLIRWGFPYYRRRRVDGAIYSMRLILMVCIGALLLMAIPLACIKFDAFESLISPPKLFNVPTHDAAFTLTLGCVLCLCLKGIPPSSPVLSRTRDS